MVQSGDVLTNPFTHQTLVIRRTAADTGGELLEMESIWEETTPSRPATHYHPRQEERFEILEGSVRVAIEGAERDLTAGDSLIVKPGTPHEMWAPAGRARARWQTRPAQRSERFYATLWNLAADGLTSTTGVPSVLRIAPILLYHRDEFRLAGSWALQQALFTVLAPLARARGYGAWYDRAGPEAAPQGG
jgi:mannose-6-phosphate isomerase-like protein (cupin superfamily)